MNDPQPSAPPKAISSSQLLVFFLASFVAAVIIAVTAMLMTLGTGLGSSPDEPVSQVSQFLWGISGLAFVPCTVLFVVLVATHKRIVATVLALTVMVAGVLTAVGWFIDSGGEMPGTTQGDVLVVLVIVVPLIAGGLMLAMSRTIGGSKRPQDI